MFWQIYWILDMLFMFYVFVIMLSPHEIVLTTIDYIDYCFAMFALVGMFGFSFKKTVLNPTVWRFYLPFIILWDIGYTFTRPIKSDDGLSMYHFVALAFMIVILLPLYIALFLYGFRSHLLWSTKKKATHSE